MRLVMDAMRKTRVKMVLACLLAMVVLLPAGRAMAAEDTMKYVAGSETLSKSVQFIDFMKKNQITVDVVAPADAESVKRSNVVVIEGGMDDAAIKKLVTDVAGAAEAGSVAKAGAKKMFMKENMWQPGQKVLVFAGANAEAAAACRVENRETWLKYFKDWFDLGEGPETLKGY
jgi:hypothetical protein